MSLPPGTSARLIFDEIYSALDRGKFTDAIRLCQRSEVAKLSLAQALLSYCFATTRQTDKALEMARSVMGTNPSDEPVFNALGCTLKLCRADAEFATLYENVTKQPTGATEYNLFELFFCYGRMNDSKKMQQVAQRIYKITDNARYLFWSVSCMLLQKDLPSAMLVVAEKMLKKVFFDIHPKQAPGAEELHLYLITVIKQGKLEEAVAAIKTLTSRDQNAKITDDDHFKENVNLVALQKLQVSSLLVDIYCKLGDFQEVMTVLREINGDFPDQWNTYELQNYLVLLSLGIDYKTNNLNAVSDLVCFQQESLLNVLWKNVPTVVDKKQIVDQHLSYLQVQKENNARLRGPYLAELYFITACVSSAELRSILVEINAAVSPWQHLSQLLTQYISKFESKYCCFTDIKTILFRLQDFEADSRILEDIQQFVEGKLSLKLADVITSLSSRIVIEESTSIPTTVDKAQEDGSEDEKDVKVLGEKEPETKSKKKRGKKKKAGNSNSIMVGTESSNATSLEVKKIDKERIQSLVSKEEGAVIDMCIYCQLENIRSYCNQLVSNPSETIRNEAFAIRQKLFLLSHSLFKNGIGGEIRIVQPGDDLLLLNSSLFRKQYTVESASSSSKVFSLLLEWCSLLNFAVQASAYSYSLKIDLLEVCRLIGQAQLALATFVDLGVKNIQNDSLSYLVLPTLIEQGWWVDAIKQSRTVLHCAVAGKREALDMMGKAFEFGNFNKVLELNDFAEKTSQSLLLNVVKAELPSLELAQNKLTLLDATVYLQDYLDGNLPESVNIMSQPEVSKLKCNADFSIISRNESCPEGAELTEREKSLRIIQMHRRLTGSQHHIHFWGNFLCESYNAAYSHLISYLETLEFEDKSKEYLKFSQSIQVSTSFSRLHNKLLSLNARIFLNLQNSVSSINSFQEQEDIISLSEKLNECVVETNEYFMLMHKAAAEGEIGKIRWYLSDISFFMKGAIPVISLAVQSMFSKFSSAFGEVAKNAFLGLSESTVENMEFLCISATSDIQNGVFYVIAYNWIVLLGNLEKQLTKAKDSAVPDPHLLENIVDSFFLESWIGVDYHLNTKVILDTAVFRKHASMTCKKLTESNKLTMERLDTLLSERINILLTTCKEITKV